jgi:intein-encoded DNA endonuclease-like protein
MKQRYLSDDEKTQIIKLYNDNLNTNQIAQLLNRSQSTIERYLKKNGYKINYGSRLTDEDRQLIIQLYLEGKTCTEIWQHYFTDKYNSSAMIERVIRRNNLSKGKYIKPVAVNHNYFTTIDDEHKAYWLGFLTADGNVRYKSSNSCVISLQLRHDDKYILEYFKNDINAEVNIGEYQYGKKHCAVINIYSKQWAQDLQKYDIVPNKTFLINKLPDIPINLMKHFIRGYFDGNGCIMLYKPKDQNLRRLKLSICGTQKFLQSLNQFLADNVGTNNQKLIDMNKYNTNVFNLRYHRQEDVLKFCEYIYSECTICLQYKYNKYLQYRIERNI